jgi:hypothetical protein
MRKLITLLLVHAGIGLTVYLLIQTIKGDFAQKTYDARMKSLLRPFLMPGTLANRERWVRSQKAMAWVALPIVVVIYVLILWKVVS